MDKRKLKELIELKRKRSVQFETQYQYLNLVEEELSNTKIKRLFGTSYLRIKRFMLKILSLIFILGGIITYFNPKLIYQHSKIDEYLIKETEKYYNDVADETLKKYIMNFSETNLDLSINNFFKTLKIELTKAIETEVHQTVINLSILLIALGFLLLYISRLTKKIRIKNKQISETEERIEKVIIEFKNIVDSEKNELESLENIYDNKIVGNN